MLLHTASFGLGLHTLRLLLQAGRQKQAVLGSKPAEGGFLNGEGIFLAFLGKGPFGLGILSAFSNKLGKSSQMKRFLIFCKGGPELHVVIKFYII